MDYLSLKGFLMLVKLKINSKNSNKAFLFSFFLKSIDLGGESN